MARTSSTPAAASSDALPVASAGLYFLAAIVPMTGLMARGWKTGVPWGDVCVLCGGMIAAAAAARTMALAPSLAGTLRAAATAHGTAAIATVAVCAFLLANFPAPRPMIDVEAPESLGRMVYTGAVEPFFLAQLALGLAAALAFRALTRPVRPMLADRASTVPHRWGGERGFAALSVASYLVTIGAAYAAFQVRWLSFTPRASHDARIAFVLQAMPALVGALAAAATAGRIARSRFGAALPLAVAVHSIAAAASSLLVGVAWALYRYAVADQLLAGIRIPPQPLSLSMLLLNVSAGTTAGLLFWAAAFWTSEGAEAVEPVGSAPTPARPVGGSDAVASTCAGALCYFALALIPALGLAEFGWQRERYSRWPAIPWADTLVVVIGTVSMAVAAPRVVRAPTLARALDVGGMTHACGGVLTAVVTLFVVIPSLPRGVLGDMTRGPYSEEIARGLAPYLVFQVALGLTLAAILHLWSRRGRPVKGADHATLRAPQWTRAPRLAAAGAACFLTVSSLATAALVATTTTAREVSPTALTGGRRGSPSRGGTSAGALIPIVLGTIAGAWSAGAISRARASQALAIGGSVQFVAGSMVAPLAVPGTILSWYLDPSIDGLRDAVLLGTFRTIVGPYGWGLVLWAALAIVQAVIGAVAGLLLWSVTRPWARTAAAA